MPDRSHPPTPPPDPLAEIADAARSEHVGSGGSRPRVSRDTGRGVVLGVLRACCAGILLAGLLPTLLLLAAWVSGAAARMSATPDPDTPLGRDPVRWRVEKYLRYFPLDACPLGFAVGFFGRGALEVARRRAGPRGRVSTRTRALVGLLIAVFLGVACVEWYLALPDRPQEGGISIRRDPIEDDPHVRPLIRAAEREADVELKDVPRQLGFVHAYWGTKKRILREKYGVEWRTPAELSPRVAFD